MCKSYCWLGSFPSWLTSFTRHDISEPRLSDLEADLWETKRRNYRVIPTHCLEEDGSFVHDDFDCDSWWEAGSERESEEADDE